MMHLARFDERYRNGGDRLTKKEWRIILNKTINCNGAELGRMVEKAARALFHQGKEIHIGLSELLEQREMMMPLYVRDTDRILAIENRAKYVYLSTSIDKRLFSFRSSNYYVLGRTLRSQLIFLAVLQQGKQRKQGWLKE